MIKESEFKPAWWLSGKHRQTIWQALFRRYLKLDLIRERIELLDGDFIDVDWLKNNSHLPDNSPIVLVLHGLAGGIRSPYARGLLKALETHGLRGVFMNFRGCSGAPNRLPRSYHSGETEDINTIVTMIRNRYPTAPIGCVGYSLGGNVLLKWLGETGQANPLTTGVAVSVPFDLQCAVDHINQGTSRPYQWWLLYCLKRHTKKKFSEINSPIDLTNLSKYWDFKNFDENITAPLHGFDGAEDYYQKSSSRFYLKNISIPTLILHALDDPFFPSDRLPNPEELSDTIELELCQDGGHVGFISGKKGPLFLETPEFWLEHRIPEHLHAQFAKAAQ